MKNVLHIINGEFFSGAERVQDLLALKLCEFGYDVFFATLKEGVFAEHCQSDRSRIFDFHMHSKFDFRKVFAMAAFAKKNKCCLIHTHTPRSSLIGMFVSTISKIPMVHHAHSPTASCTENSWRNLINPFFENLAIKKCRKIIAVSNSIAESLGRKIPGQLISCVPNGVPTPGVLQSRPSPVGPWVIGIVALFRPRKGLEVLLDSLAILKASGASFVLKAVGGFETKEYQDSIKEQARCLNLVKNIEWVGFKQDVNRELRNMDIFVLPSLFGEGTPMVILEAMAVGTPLVATAVEGVPEVVRDGQEGLLVAPGDKEALFKALQRFTSGEADWQALRQKAFLRQSTGYSDKRMAADVAAIYDNILVTP